MSRPRRRAASPLLHAAQTRVLLDQLAEHCASAGPVPAEVVAAGAALRAALAAWKIGPVEVPMYLGNEPEAAVLAADRRRARAAGTSASRGAEKGQ